MGASMRSTLLTAIVLGALATSASAAVVAEVEPNESIATAQNLDGNFTTDFVAGINNAGVNISTTVPHVTVTNDSVILNGLSDDFFSFTATAGTTGVFDIDGFFVNGTNSVLTLFDTLGAQVATNDNGTDGTEVLGSDSFLTHAFTQSGTYTIQVQDNVFGLRPVNQQTVYTLHISVPLAGAPVPEPGTWALFGLGVIGLGGLVRRRRRQRATAAV